MPDPIPTKPTIHKQPLFWPSSDGPSECYPAIGSGTAAREYLNREGFIVLRNAVPYSLCTAAKAAFNTEVKPDRSYFLRHESGKYEQHVFTEANFMKYPIMNVQDLSEKKFPRFRRLGLDIVTQPAIQRAVKVLLGETGRVIHTMYFDGNQVTWPHRDAHYIDSERSGEMIAVWIALEDIHPDAGRFYVCPRSHRTKIPGVVDENSLDPNGPGYKSLIADYVNNGPLECVAPQLKQGDAIFWSALTIHGSLPTLNPRYSRRSFTAHYIGASDEFRWNYAKTKRTERATRTGKPESIIVNGVSIALHEDQSDWRRQLKLTMAARLPGAYTLLRTAKSAWQHSGRANR